jgi:MoxR-vWA-beta-propeller ternary system domain bpX2
MRPDPGLDAIRCASLPATALAALADLRRERGVAVTVAEDRAFVRWSSESEEVLRRVRPIAGVELYSRRGGLWYRHGHHLPTFGLPIDEEESVSLHRAVTPNPVRPEPPAGIPPRPVELTLVRDGRVREATALGCGLDELGRWADMAPTARLVALRAAIAGDRVLLLGRRLPPIPGAERYWGGHILVPLGLRTDPELPEPALRGALGAGEDELLVITHEGAETVPLRAFRTATRAGVRLALEGRPT